MAIEVVTSPVKFMGGFVKSFNSTFGFNSTPSVLNVTILSVPGEAVFSPGPLGGLHVLDLSTFGAEANYTFAGILTSVNHKFRDIAGDVYDVQLSDPRLAMKGVHLVLAPNPGSGALAGGTTDRVIDVFNFVSNDASGVDLATFEAGGTNYKDVLFAVGMLASGSQPSRLGAGVASGNFQPSIWGEDYKFFFNDESLLSDDFKITGEIITLLDLFQQMGDGNAFDWHVDGPVVVSGVNEVTIQTISRQTENTAISMSGFITTLDGGATPEVVNQASSGIELREDPTGAIVYSDRVESLDLVNQSGVLSNHYPIAIPNTFYDDTTFFSDPDRFLNSSISDNIQPHRVKLTLDEDFNSISEAVAATSGYMPEDDELRAALVGFENWTYYIGIVRAVPIAGDPNFPLNLEKFSFNYQAISEAFWNDFVDGRPKYGESVKLEDLQTGAFNSAEYAMIRKLRHAYDVVKKSAEELYGRVFIYRERNDSIAIDAATTRTISIASVGDGAEVKRKWTKGFVYKPPGEGRRVFNISSIPSSSGASLAADNFFDSGEGKGKTQAYACYAGVSATDLEEAKVVVTENPDNILFDGGNLYVKADVSKGLIKVSPVFDLENTPCVINDIISVSVASELGIDLANCDSTDPTLQIDDDLCDAILNGDDSRYKMAATVKIPSSIYIPYKHNNDVWNIYESPGFGDGPIVVERDETLNPSNFFNFSALDDAGNAKAEKLASPVRELEMGTVTSLRLPEFNLGDAIGNNSNITNISTTFGVTSVTTTYSLESFAKRYGKIAKTTSDAFGKIIIKLQKNISRTNSELLKIGDERVKIIEDSRKFFGAEGHAYDVENPFGCDKFAFYTRNETLLPPVKFGPEWLLVKPIELGDGTGIFIMRPK